ncbi:hypothetical protein RJ639_004337 [Escallonia herrerae]|uniref:Reverse transcriptase/retrotransposon-derived protein RNase H-like domain-containing protein n=1 Tax=Escallonia herrerae TaxID=1293975 RepID=A0AA89AYH0_9ASTE|nr:hypothetical protein RJ639_004337 [Escallonia herrerae]
MGRFLARSAERCLSFFKAIRKTKDFVWTDDFQKSFEELKTYLSSLPLLSKPLPEEDLFLYLLVTKVAVSAVLVRVQKPIYYVSKVLQDVETRYPKIDKIALALIISAKRLRPSGAGIILISPEVFVVKYALCFGFQASNNKVEYEALLGGIRLAHALKVDSLSVHNDSLLVVNHVLEDYEARDKRMAQYLQLVKTLASKFKNFTIHQIPQDQNTQANTLLRLASAKVTDVWRLVYLDSSKNVVSVLKLKLEW